MVQASSHLLHRSHLPIHGLWSNICAIIRVFPKCTWWGEQIVYRALQWWRTEGLRCYACKLQFFQIPPSNVPPCVRDDTGGYYMCPRSCAQRSQPSSHHWGHQIVPGCWALGQLWARCCFCSDHPGIWTCSKPGREWSPTTRPFTAWAPGAALIFQLTCLKGPPSLQSLLVAISLPTLWLGILGLPKWWLLLKFSESSG
jgi:hypothetical protein